MRILFDQGTPVPLRDHLLEHSIVTAHEAGWASLSNGEHLHAAEAKFDLPITTDKNLRCQQAVVGRQIAILMLPTTSLPGIRGCIHLVVAAVGSTKPGLLVERLSFDQ